MGQEEGESRTLRRAAAWERVAAWERLAAALDWEGPSWWRLSSRPWLPGWTLSTLWLRYARYLLGLAPRT